MKRIQSKNVIHHRWESSKKERIACKKTVISQVLRGKRRWSCRVGLAMKGTIQAPCQTSRVLTGIHVKSVKSSNRKWITSRWVRPHLILATCHKKRTLLRASQQPRRTRTYSNSSQIPHVSPTATNQHTLLHARCIGDVIIDCIHGPVYAAVVHGPHRKLRTIIPAMRSIRIILFLANNTLLTSTGRPQTKDAELGILDICYCGGEIRFELKQNYYSMTSCD